MVYQVSTPGDLRLEYRFAYLVVNGTILNILVRMSKQPWPQKPEEIERYLLGFDFFERYVHGHDEGEQYVKMHSRRFLETFAMLPDLPPGARVLELGAIPYYFTILLTKFYGVEVDVLSFYESEPKCRTTHTVSNRQYNEEYSFDYQAINVEKEVFPFADKTFDLVVCCELLEHLLINPSHMLYEIHRVLRPSGYLIMSTPNVLRWNNITALLNGRNIYDTYHGNGIYGRHNREYSPAEVAQLLTSNEFEIESLETRSVYGSSILDRVPVLSRRRGDNIFVRARTVNTHRQSYPSQLFSLMHEYRNVVHSSFTMGKNETGQLGRGWHQFEQDSGFRWSDEEAQFFLKPNGGGRILIRACSHHPKLASGMAVTVSLQVNGRTLGKQNLPDHDWHDLEFDLKETDGEPVLECAIQVSDVWVPGDKIGSNDRRRLGIGVQRIWLG